MIHWLNKNMKKILLTMGSIATIAIPITTTIACGAEKSGPNFVVELGQKDTNGKFLKVVLNLAVGADVFSNANAVAKDIIKTNKASFDDAKTEIIMKTPSATDTKTFGDFKNLSSVPNKLTNGIKDADLIKYITELFTELVQEAQ